MSTTANDIINRALRKVGALAAGETPGSDMTTDALSDLNAMLARWLDNGITIGQGEAILTDYIPLDDADEDAVVYNLAKVLLLEYPNPNAVLIIQMANNLYDDILAKYDDPGELQVETDILPYRKYNINIS